MNGRHDKCAHRPGGPQEGGVWSFPLVEHPKLGWVFGEGPVDLDHIWRCPCDCHSAAPVGHLALWTAA